MVEVLNWHGTAEQEAVVRRAMEALSQGELVAFPGETAYGVAANAQCPEAIARLAELPTAPTPCRFPFAVADSLEALDWVPNMSALGRRLTRRCWPGPVTFVFRDGIEQGKAGQLPEAVRNQLCPEGRLGLCAPIHDAPWNVLRLAKVPVAWAELQTNGTGSTETAADLAQRLGDKVSLLIDGGPTREGKPPTVVEVMGDRWEMLYEGAVSASELGQQTTRLIVFVCTGNTCRSPMAEVLCAKLLAERLACSPADLPSRGFLVLSAGVAAYPGDPAAVEAAEVVREFGADLAAHSSQPLTAELVHQADHLITMTRGHAAAVMGRFAGYGPSPRLLCPEGNDIPDPIGADQDTYRQCARTIQSSLERLLAELCA